jgi:hypothetical protein
MKEPDPETQTHQLATYRSTLSALLEQAAQWSADQLVADRTFSRQLFRRELPHRLCTS